MVDRGGSFLSHISDDGRKESIRTHLNEVASMAEGFADAFGAGSWAYAAGLAHDVGKYSEAFQRRILHDGPRVDHSTAGAWELQKMQTGTPLSYCVAGHHGGMPDGGSLLDGSDDSTLSGRFKRAESGLICDCSSFVRYVDLTQPGAWNVLRSDRALDGFSLSFVTRMVFSCLVDSDYLCTERFMNGAERQSLRFDRIEDLRGMLEKKIESFAMLRYSTPLNSARSELLDDCLSASACEPGFFSLTVPTGGGKTLSSMWFALNHAIAPNHEMNRVIYVAPYTSIIEQNAQVYREVFGCENVVEHHSNFDFDGCGFIQPSDSADSGYESDVRDRMRLASENWDAPLIVTTVVQLFESLFSNRPSRCRKLHNIARSVIVLDEAQMIPASQLKPCMRALVELVNHYGCTVVLCTATQPALGKVLGGFQSSVREIVPNPSALADKLKRVGYVWEGSLSDGELIEAVCANDQALCVVNNRRQAKALFDSLDERKPGSVFHLSTLMHSVHRSLVLDEVRGRLRRGEPCLLVSTSLIEAGVDIDFPAVFRALAGLDSLVQCAGRCNREGTALPDESLVHVFEPAGTEYALPADTRQRAEIARAVLASSGCEDGRFDAGDVSLMDDYFSRLFDMQASLDKSRAYERLSAPRQEESIVSIPFKSVADDFRIIEEGSCAVIIPDAAVEEDIVALRSGMSDRSTLRRLMRYSVAVYEADIKNLRQLGAVSAIDQSTFVLLDSELYDIRTGLNVNAEGGRAICF